MQPASNLPGPDDQCTALLRAIEQGKLSDGLVLARTLTERFPAHGPGWKFLGALLWGEGRTEEALAAMQTSVGHLPHDAEAHKNLGTALVQLKRFDAASPHLRRATQIDPGLAEPHYQLAMIDLNAQRFTAAQVNLRAGLAVRGAGSTPDDVIAHSALLVLMSQDPAVDADELFAEHCRFGEHVEGPLRASWPRHVNRKDPKRRLKIGFASGDLRDHAVATFIEPVLVHLTGAPGLEVHAYYNHVIDDAVTRRLRGAVEHWHAVAPLSDAELAQRIHDDGIDILIDLSGHTSLNRLRTFARKPAPIQVSWLGYPGTTGLRAMDYYLADRHWLPPGEFDAQFTEQLAYLPFRWSFQPHATAPTVSTLPALLTGQLTFGSFNHLRKINIATVNTWAGVLRALPAATMVLAAMPSDEMPCQLIEQFAAAGIATERLTFIGRRSMDAYLDLHHRVDICLDTHPYAGGTTTMHALWMGVPTLTLAGTTSFARAGAGIMGQLGLHEFVAADRDDFVAKGLYWAAHLEALAEIRGGLRARMQNAPGGRPDLYAADLEAALRHMWRRWCHADRAV